MLRCFITSIVISAATLIHFEGQTQVSRTLGALDPASEPVLLSSSCESTTNSEISTSWQVPIKMATRVKLDLDHSKFIAAEHDGMHMPECYEPLADHMAKVKVMEIREDDVMLCTFPKSGTHWMYRMIDLLQRGTTEYNERTMDSTFIDLQRIELLPELASPRVLCTHLPFDRLPQQVKDKRTKMVHVYRNPKAVLVSFYFMVKSDMYKQKSADFTLDNMAAMFFSDKMVYHGWFGYMDRAAAFQRQNPNHPILNVSYEEMTQNPLDTVKKLAEFLEKSVTPEFCSQVVEACSFKKQKETEENLNSSQAAMNFYRKGDMNDWKNHLTVAVNEKINQILAERADTCPFSAKYAELSSAQRQIPSKKNSTCAKQ